MQEDKDLNSGRATIKDIARKVGVSTATVSLALSHNPRISEKTSMKVFEAVRAMGYMPSSAARSLVMNRSRNISLIVPQLGRVFLQPFFALSINGIYDACIENGYRVQLEVASAEFVERKRYLKLFRERTIDGMIYAGSTFLDEYLKELAEHDYPFIFSGSFIRDSRLSFVTGDNRAGGRMATEHLIKTGRKRIAHICGDLKVPSVSERLEGYREGLEAAGMEYDPSIVAECDFTEEGAGLALRDILKYAPDAVFAGNDTMAAGIINALRENGRDIPRDVAVCGMDDIPQSARLNPPLTTIRYDIYEIARRAAVRLIEMIEGRAKGTVEEVLPVELVVRDSCGGGENKLRDYDRF